MSLVIESKIYILSTKIYTPYTIHYTPKSRKRTKKQSFLRDFFAYMDFFLYLCSRKSLQKVYGSR